MTNPLSIIFIGTAGIGSPLLKALAEDNRFNIPLVITQIDKPAGRRMELAPSPIKKTAEDLNIPIFQPENINEAEEEIKKSQPDLLLVFAYGQILKKNILDIPTIDCINIHTSLLPKYRGASPIQSCLLNGDNETGVTIMKMEERMDTGPVYEAFKLPIPDNLNSTELHDALADLSAIKVPEILSNLLSPIPQNEEEATYCTKISKSDGVINWEESAEVINNKIRAYAGWPGSFTMWNDKRLKILSAEVFDTNNKSPGLVFKKEENTYISAFESSILLKEVQIEGKTSQSIDEFSRGHEGFVGSQL